MNEINNVIELIHKGDEVIRNEFIKQYEPFILNKVVSVTGRYVEKENDEELIIGMLAFNEAIDKFEGDKGLFLSFASLKIKQRILDYLRKEQKHVGLISLDKQEVLNLQSNDQLDLKIEMNMFKDKLSYFNISLEELIHHSPKHKKSIFEVTKLGSDVSKNERIRKKLYKSKKLPVADVALTFVTSIKRVKLFKTYIVAVVLVFHEQLETIKSYLQMEDESHE